MALITRLWREERFAEVAGCPRAGRGQSADTSACARCRYNLLAPGETNLGCEWRTEAARYFGALEALRALAPEEADRLQFLLDEGRRGEGPLGPELLDEVVEALTAWWKRSPEPPHRELVAAALRLSLGAKLLGEPVVVLR